MIYLAYIIGGWAAGCVLVGDWSGAVMSGALTVLCLAYTVAEGGAE